MKRVDIPKLIAAYGGAAQIAKITGTVRTAPYGWAKRGYISSRVLEALKTHDKRFNLNRYFYDEERKTDGGD